MAKTFCLADHISAVAPVSESDTTAIKMIPAEDLRINDKNFYSTDNIESLVDSILMYGILDPLIVCPDGEGYTIISGHRRYCAITKILLEGLSEDKSKFEKIPCIIRNTKDDLLEELMLIQANSTTRVLNSAELGKQAAKVETLLYRLKEQGYEFPGRMRDAVAAACKVSASKIARIKVIQKNLIPDLKKYYEKDQLSESVAYEIARLPQEQQKEFFDFRIKAHKGNEKTAVYYMSKYKVDDYKESAKKIKDISCPLQHDKCTHREWKLKRLFEAEFSYKPCASVCCSACGDLRTCRNACPELADKVAELKALKKAEDAEKKAEAEKESCARTEFAKRIWQRFGAARRRANKSAKEVCKAGEMYWYSDSWERYEAGDCEYTPATLLPLSLTRSEIKRIIALADALDCSLDYLFCRSDDPEEKAGDRDERF